MVSGGRVGRTVLIDIRQSLSDRDLAVATRLAELRLMTVAQIETLHFPVADFASELSSRRVARRVLERLTRQRVVVRLNRRIGGVTAGSAGYIYALGPVGARVMTVDGVRRHYREPSEAFLAHTLAISELAVGLLAGQSRKEFEVLSLEAEPRCWRSFNGLNGHQVLRPDLFVSLGIGEFEHRIFVEVDLGTEHLPTLVRKCQAYLAYYRSGSEQAHHGVFPTVWWVLQTHRRAEQLKQALDRSKAMVEGLFVVTTADLAASEMTKGTR